MRKVYQCEIGIILKTEKKIFHIYCQYYFSFEQCNYTIAPNYFCLVVTTNNNYNFACAKNPVSLNA